MAIHTIPLDPTLTHYDLQISLDGVNYTLEFRWNTRESKWYMDVRTEEGDPIYVGLALVVDHPLGKRCRDTRFPSGVLVAVDTSSARQDPGIADLGDRVKLLYYEASELPVDVTGL